MEIKLCHLSQMPIFIYLYIKLKELSNVFQHSKIKGIDMVYINHWSKILCMHSFT